MNIQKEHYTEVLQAIFEKEYALPNEYDTAKYIDGAYMMARTSEAYDRWYRARLARDN